MDTLTTMRNLKGIQAAVFRQILKTHKEFVFISDVVEFTDLTSEQVRASLRVLKNKGLVVSFGGEAGSYVMYKLAY